MLSHWYWCVDLEWQNLTQYITIGDVLPLILGCKGNGGEIVHKKQWGICHYATRLGFPVFWKILKSVRFFRVIKAPFGQQNGCETSWKHWRSHGILALSWWMKIVTTPPVFEIHPKSIGSFCKGILSRWANFFRKGILQRSTLTWTILGIGCSDLHGLNWILPRVAVWETFATLATLCTRPNFASGEIKCVNWNGRTQIHSHVIYDSWCLW